jgi:hypothetical protein
MTPAAHIALRQSLILSLPLSVSGASALVHPPGWVRPPRSDECNSGTESSQVFATPSYPVLSVSVHVPG